MNEKEVRKKKKLKMRSNEMILKSILDIFKPYNVKPNKMLGGLENVKAYTLSGKKKSALKKTDLFNSDQKKSA